MAGWQWFGNLHRKVFLLSGGRIGGSLVGMPVLLLTTVGRKSGERRTTPMPFYADGDRFVIVGSNNGGPRDPAWWLNLRADPKAQIQIRRARQRVVARLAEGEERARLWPLLTTFNPRYLRYAQMTDRTIPVVILEPRAQP